MDESSADNEPKKEMTSKQIIAILIFLAIVTPTLTFMFGPNILGQIHSYWGAKQPPKFEFQYEDVLEPNVPVYEVTEHLADIGSLLGKVRITVTTDYGGNNVRGTVCIRIRRANEVPVRLNQSWENFQISHSESRSLFLTPSDLFNYSRLSHKSSALNLTQGDPTADRRGQFDIEIVHNNKILANKTITVVNTPWFHSTQLSDSVIQVGEPITTYVTVRNLGSPSKFIVFGDLYDSTSADTSTIEGTDWGPNKSWKLLDYYGNIETDVIDTNGELTVPFVIPGSFFEERHTYILETCAVKYLPYLKFPEGYDWRTSKHSWRVRDPPHYSTIVVLAQ